MLRHRDPIINNKDHLVGQLTRAWVETAIVHLETVARVEARDHTDQPVTQVDLLLMVMVL